MPFSKLDTAAVARTLSQIAEQAEDVVDAFFERREEVELAPEGEPGGLRVWREEGFAVPLARAVRAHHVGFPWRIAVRRHRRWVQVVGPRLVAPAESETFYSCSAES